MDGSIVLTPVVGWRRFITIHPACDVLPLLPPDQLRELADDIKKNGMRESIRVSKAGVLFDGRNRLDALELLGEPIIDPTTGTFTVRFHAAHIDEVGSRAPFDDEALVCEVISRNIRRRHLSEQDRVTLVLKVWETMNAAAKPEPISGPSPLSEEPSPVKVQRPVGGGPGKLRGSTKSIVGAMASEAGMDRKTARKHLAARGVVPKRKPKARTPPSTSRLVRVVMGYEKVQALMNSVQGDPHVPLVEIVTKVQQFRFCYPDAAEQVSALCRLLAQAVDDGSLGKAAPPAVAQSDRTVLKED